MNTVSGVLAAGAFAMGLVVTSPASAEEYFFKGESAPLPPREIWYGWQTLSTDGVAAVMATTALAIDNGGSTEFWGLGIGTYTLGAPLVHAVHGRPWVALGDFALRLGVPFLGMALGSRLDGPVVCPADTGCRSSDTGIIAGGLIGAGAVSALDAAAFTYDPPQPVKSHYAQAARPRIWPNLAVTSKGGRVGVAGSF